MFLIFAAFLFSSVPFKSVHATAAFARQTGEPCATCHVQAYGPWLTQYGMKFKLDGYVAGHANELPDLLNAFSAEIVASVTNTQKDVPTGTYFQNNAANSNANNNVVNDWDALYYTGRVTDHIGSYLQLNFDPQMGRSISLAMADIRYANHFDYKGNNITYGVTVNDFPTMSDFWMTTYAWMYPYTTSSAAPAPAAQPFLETLMDEANSAGATAYMMLNNHYYLEAGAYTSMSKSMSNGLGVWGGGTQGGGLQYGRIIGGAPYWRAFYQNFVGRHMMMIGTFGLIANVAPYYMTSAGTDTYAEYNIDANYGFMMDENNWLRAMVRLTRDDMNNNASQQLGIASNSSDHLNSIMMMGMWSYKQTYNLMVGWNAMSGNADKLLYNGGADVPRINGSFNGSPNTNAFLFELDYVPFGKEPVSWQHPFNLRLSAQYWAYTQFNGASNNYDGFGRSAQANNTFYFVGNLMF